MGSDAVLVVVFSLVGIAIGVAATILASRGRTVRKTYHSAPVEEEDETLLIHGEAVDVRELRVLRALFGEPKGRRLESFKAKYYRPSLDATIEKGWVKRVGRRYHLTSKGGEFCATYLNQLLSEWKPAEYAVA